MKILYEIWSITNNEEKFEIRYLTHKKALLRKRELEKYNLITDYKIVKVIQND